MLLDQHIIDFGNRELEKIAHRLQELQEQWGELQAKRNAWILILDGNAPEQSVEGEQASNSVQEPAAKSEDSDITGRARAAISATGKYGFKPKDITVKVESMGVRLASGFVSNLLFRLKKRHEVIEHNGRYYLPQFDPTPQDVGGIEQDQQQTPP